MNIAGSLKDDGMIRSGATSLVGEVREPSMEWMVLIKGSVSLLVESQRKRYVSGRVILWAEVAGGRGKLPHVVELVVGHDQVVGEEDQHQLLVWT